MRELTGGLGAHSVLECVGHGEAMRTAVGIVRPGGAVGRVGVPQENLAGDLEPMARSVVKAMNDTGVPRLIWISSMGIYDEVPGQRYRSVLDPYRDSAHVIEASDLDYTILRPAWFSDANEIDYETTQKGEPFKGGVVSRKSVAALVIKLATSPGLEVRRSLGVSKPE